MHVNVLLSSDFQISFVNVIELCIRFSSTLTLVSADSLYVLVLVVKSIVFSFQKIKLAVSLRISYFEVFLFRESTYNFF